MCSQVFKNKQDFMEDQLQHAKLHISKMDQRPEPASAPQQSLQQPPPPLGTYLGQSPIVPILNALLPHQQNLPPPVSIPNQFPQDQIPTIPPWLPAQAQEASTQQCQLPPTHQPQHTPVVPPHQQYPLSFQQSYGPTTQMYEPPLSRANSDFLLDMDIHSGSSG